jgi:type I restriction enzyme S subunit
MTPKELIDAFEVLADAPDGVERLRGLVLQLAVQGKLVPQDPADEPASVLPERIAAEKARLVKEKMIKRSKPLPPIAAEELPFNIPDSWSWVRLVELAAMINGDRGKNYPSRAHFVEEGIAFINAGHLNAGGIDYREMNYISKDRFDLLKSGKVLQGDLLYCLRGSLGKSGIVQTDEPAAIASSLLIIRAVQHILPKFTYTVLISPFGAELISRFDNGSAQPNLSASNVAKYPLPISPLAEQQRIVTRVDELMALLDRLEAAQGSREATRQALRDAALSALRDAADPETVQFAWTRIANQMEQLFTDPGDIPRLRQTILQLAVRGRLVSQDPADESAEDLLSCMAVEADESGGKKKPRGNGQPLGQDAGPFELPDGWAWSTADRLGDIIGGGTPSKNDPRFWGGDIPWVSPKDMKRPYIGESIDTVTPAAVAGSSAKEIEAGALLMVVRGMILAHSFPTALTTRVVTVNQDMKALIPLDKEMGPYLLLATNGLKSEVLDLVERSTHGTCKLPTDKLFGMPIPIPPLAEQRRIVSKVEELTTLCDGLEARLERARKTRVSFAISAVASFV